MAGAAISVQNIPDLQTPAVIQNVQSVQNANLMPSSSINNLTNENEM